MWTLTSLSSLLVSILVPTTSLSGRRSEFLSRWGGNAPEPDQLWPPSSPQVPSVPAPCSGAPWGSGSVPRLRGARGPAALRGLVREDGQGGRRAHQDAAGQTLRGRPPEDRCGLGELSLPTPLHLYQTAAGLGGACPPQTVLS